MRVTDTIWFTTTIGTVGVVFGVDEATGKKKAYIGPVPGLDEKVDTRTIVMHGAKLELSMAIEIVHRLSD